MFISLQLQLVDMVLINKPNNKLKRFFSFLIPKKEINSLLLILNKVICFLYQVYISQIKDLINQDNLLRIKISIKCSFNWILMLMVLLIFNNFWLPWSPLDFIIFLSEENFSKDLNMLFDKNTSLTLFLINIILIAKSSYKITNKINKYNKR